MNIVETVRGDRSGLLIIADHASNHIPPEIALGLSPTQLTRHIAFDIGTGALTRRLASLLGAPAILATTSRLVADCNRSADDAGAIPESSDGEPIPGNRALTAAARQRRIAAYHEPYHAALAEALDADDVRLLVSLHSFTPALVSRPLEKRPWHVGLLYNCDDRAARIAMRLLADEGLAVGDNLPYSGAHYGYTTDRHAEPRRLPYLTFEIRQDLLADAAGILEWAARLKRVVEAVAAELQVEVKEKAQ